MCIMKNTDNAPMPLPYFSPSSSCEYQPIFFFFFDLSIDTMTTARRYFTGLNNKNNVDDSRPNIVGLNW